MTEWIPKTKLGKLVKSGEITTMSQALAGGLALREVEIVDILLPNIEDEVLDVNLVQRMTDSGQRMRFAITTVVGNLDGFVGIGHTKGKEAGPAIETSIKDAKINIIEIKRGCGSWECGCYKPHTLPFLVRGRCGSVEVILKPAPGGVGLAVGDVVKSVLRLAGIKDAWGFTRGKSKTTINFAYAAYDALSKTSNTKVSSKLQEKLKIVSGGVGEVVPLKTVPHEELEPEPEIINSEEKK